MPGETDIAVMELFKPVFNPDTSGVTYDVEVLAKWQQSLDMEFSEAPTNLADLTALLAPPCFSLTTAHKPKCGARPTAGRTIQRP